MNCDLCSNPATVHTCEIRNGRKIERHLCSQHSATSDFSATEELLPGQMMINGVICSTAQEAAVRGMFDNIRSTTNFMRQYGRMPSNFEELRQGVLLPDDGPPMNCDLCDNPATVHVCEIHDGKKTERHLCHQHAETEELLPGQVMVNGVVCSSAQEAAVRGMSDNLRGTRNFLRQHGRMPSTVEDVKKGMLLPDDGPVTHMQNDLLQEYRRLDATVRFIQDHGRMPESSDEWKALNTAVPTFEGWLERLFRERDESEPNDADEIPSEKWLIYFTRLFENCSTLLKPYSDAQVKKAVRFFIDLGESDQPLSLRNLGIPWTVRSRAIESMTTLFRDCFVRCSHGLSHLDEARSNPLNGLCYMWWDIAPWHGEPEDVRFAESDQAMLDVMKQTLRINHDACRESALHGLGHWEAAYPQVVAKIVDEFLDQNPTIRPDLKEYALRARYGGVQ